MWSTNFEIVGADTGATLGTEITPPGSANTKGSYFELIASTSFLVSWFQVYTVYQTSNGSLNTWLFDISTGAAASEVVLVADCLWNTMDNQGGYAPLEFIVEIGNATRVSARCQIETGDTPDVFGMELLIAENANIVGDDSPVTYGANTATSGGVDVDPGGSANTKGAYSELTASTSAIFNHATIVLGNQDNDGRSNGNWLLDIATGAAASEVVGVPDLLVSVSDTTNTFYQMGWGFGFPQVPVSTRLSARSQSNITDATDRTFDLVLITTNPIEPTSGGGGGETSSVF